TIANDNTDNIGLIDINWKNDKSQPLISYGTGTDKILLKINIYLKVKISITCYLSN
ncbi:215_t:CDS:1, partial [Gigaspora rosea]